MIAAKADHLGQVGLPLAIQDYTAFADRGYWACRLDRLAERLEDMALPTPGLTPL
jgi:hypothetical protein